MRWLASLCVLGLVAVSAAAQPRSANLAGIWAFETAPTAEAGCVISGRAHLTPTEPGRYDVRMQVLQHCEEVFDDVHTEQTCTARVEGAHFALDCRLITAPDTPYLPDNFSLAIRNAGLMEGHLISGWTASAVWRRDGDAFVS